MVGKEFNVEAPEALADEMFKRILDSAPRFGLFVTGFSHNKLTGQPSKLSFSVMGLEANISAFEAAIKRFVAKAIAEGAVPPKK